MTLIVGKYPVEVRDIIEVQMPAGALPLHFDFQRGVLCVWAVIDPDALEVETKRFRMAGTGHDLDVGETPIRFMNTLLLHGGELVFHFFELGHTPTKED